MQTAQYVSNSHAALEVYVQCPSVTQSIDSAGGMRYVSGSSTIQQLQTLSINTPVWQRVIGPTKMYNLCAFSMSAVARCGAGIMLDGCNISCLYNEGGEGRGGEGRGGEGRGGEGRGGEGRGGEARRGKGRGGDLTGLMRP